MFREQSCIENPEPSDVVQHIVGTLPGMHPVAMFCHLAVKRNEAHWTYYINLMIANQDNNQ